MEKWMLALVNDKNPLPDGYEVPLKKLDNVIGVAAGPSKVNAIRAALRGKYLDILITDEDTARQLIKPVDL